MRAQGLLICLLFVTCCDESSPLAPTVPLNERFTLAPGEEVVVEGIELQLEFVQVIGDSRCPADAICIHGGDATVQVRAARDGDSTVLGLHTGDASQVSAIYRGARITLVELSPYPFSSRPIEPDDYRAILTVTQ